MGSGGSKNEKEKETRKDEVEIDGSNIHQIDSFLYEVCPSICKIIFLKKIGTGFFIKLYKHNKPLFLLMTNEHIIEKEMIEKKEEIEVYYNNQKKRIKITLNKEERFIQCYKEELEIDCSIVEILNKDKVNEDYFLLPNIDYNSNNYNELKNKIINVVQFPGGKNLSHSEGELININKYEFTHKAGTKSGSSGSPIFLADTTKVIGIHKSGNKSAKENYGDFIFPIINLLKNNIDNDNISNNNINTYNNIQKQNEVKIIIEPSGLFQPFGTVFMDINKDKCEIIINGKRGFELVSFLEVSKEFKDFIEEIIKKKDGIVEIILRETKTIRNMDNMFFNNGFRFISINFEKWDVSNVTSMKKMFFGCSCNNIKGISNWNTSNVTNMSYMFFKCKNIPDISNWDTSKVLDMSYMFSECENIPDISNWDTSKVLDMSYMFSKCFNNNIPDISNWDTFNVKNMEGLFYNSTLLSSLSKISKWNVNNVECMAHMFDGCKSLKELPDISRWGIYCVKDMSYMFQNCWALTSFPNISNWKIYNVQDMSFMFHNCWSLISFPKLNWDISNVRNMSFMFHNFPLSLINFIWNFSTYQNTNHMFTNFDNYHNPMYGNNIINVIFKINTGMQSMVTAYSDTLIMDVIDKFYIKNTNLDYPFNIEFLYNSQKLDMSLTISKYNHNGINVMMINGIELKNL